MRVVLSAILFAKGAWLHPEKMCVWARAVGSRWHQPGKPPEAVAREVLRGKRERGEGRRGGWRGRRANFGCDVMLWPAAGLGNGAETGCGGSLGCVGRKGDANGARQQRAKAGCPGSVICRPAAGARGHREGRASERPVRGAGEPCALPGPATSTRSARRGGTQSQAHSSTVLRGCGR